jgi:hypothetical protein
MKFTDRSFEIIMEALADYSVAVHDSEEYSAKEEAKIQKEITEAEDAVATIGTY